jgi:hypothetical protein
MPRVRASGNGETVFDLLVDDAVATNDERAGFVHGVLPATQDLGEHLERGRARWKADDVERGERLATHRIDVGQCVRCGDAAEGVRVVDNWRKEIDGLHQGQIVGHDKDSRIVERLTPDEQTRIIAVRKRGQGTRKVARTHLGGSTGAAGEGGEPEELVASVVWRHGAQGARGAQGATLTTASISTSAPRGRPAAWTVERAGRASPMWRPYISLNVGKSAMSCR